MLYKPAPAQVTHLVFNETLFPHVLIQHAFPPPNQNPQVRNFTPGRSLFSQVYTPLVPHIGESSLDVW